MSFAKSSKDDIVELSSAMSCGKSNEDTSVELGSDTCGEPSKESTAQSTTESISSEEEGCFTLTWEIKTFRLLLARTGRRQKLGECTSPTWETKDRNGGSRHCWCLGAYEATNSKVKFRLYACDKQKFLGRCTVSLVGISGRGDEVSLNQANDGSEDSIVFEIDKKDIVGENKLPSNALTIFCRMWQERLNTEGRRICSELRKVSHLWTVENFRSYGFFSHPFTIRDIQFYLTFDRKGKSRKYTLIAGGTPIDTYDTLSFVACDNCIIDGGGKITKSLYNLPLCSTWKDDIRILAKTKPNNTFRIQLNCTVAVHMSGLKSISEIGKVGTATKFLIRT